MRFARRLSPSHRQPHQQRLPYLQRLPCLQHHRHHQYHRYHHHQHLQHLQHRCRFCALHMRQHKRACLMTVNFLDQMGEKMFCLIRHVSGVVFYVNAKMCVCNCDGTRPYETCCWLSAYGHWCCRVSWAWIACALVLCIFVFDAVVHGVALSATQEDPLTNRFLFASHLVMLAMDLFLFVLAYLGVLLLVKMPWPCLELRPEEKKPSALSTPDEENPQPSKPSAPLSQTEGQPGSQSQHTHYEPLSQTDTR